jgi:DHA2 family multidrug resistance protein
MSLAAQDVPVLSGGQLVMGGMLLAIANFIVVLDMTIANVSVPHIAGGLAVSSIEGTYVITSYAVAEAITVPLTGWLASRFGTVRIFTWCMFLFGLFSAMCALAGNLGFLVTGRVLQGLSGGPLMPLSQTLLLRIFPKDKQAAAIGIWGTTTLVAPILGPIVGGYLCDNWGWPFIFYINIPIAMVCSLMAFSMLKRFETLMQKSKIDFVGLILLIIWVSALQIMLDEGKNYDWFASSFIITLLIIAVIGFAAFMIWEFTESQPIVDLRVFRHRGFSVSVLTISLAFGAFFGSVVLTPLWLQSYMGYTATWSGFATAMIGILAVFMAPLAANLSTKIDARFLVFGGVMWIAALIFIRSFCTTDMTYSQIAFPILIQGIGMPFFFLPLTGLALSSVAVNETASAAGLMNFLRTISGAFATSIVTTTWENKTSYYRVELVNNLSSEHANLPHLMLDQLVQQQGVMLATNQIFFMSSILIGVAALIVWLAPRPTRTADISGAH